MHARVRRPQSAGDAGAGDAVGSSRGASILPFEGSVERRERFYRALVEQTRDLITVVDRNGTIMFKNRSTEETLGSTQAEYSRDEAAATPQVVSVNQVVIELAGFLHQLVGTHIGLALSLGASSSWITIDQVLLEQVIVNLVLNARNAMPSGGVVTIATKNVARPDAAGPRRQCVAIEVTDTGVGMTQEVRERIFEPFFTTKGSEKGSGLGLSAVFSVVHQAGGRIDVETQQGRGTTFRVTLPGHQDRQEGERKCNSPSGSPRAW